VITSTRSGAAELLHEHDAGLVCPSQDVAGLAAHLRTLLDPAQRERFGTRGRAAVLPLTASAMTLKLVLLYKDLLGATVARRAARRAGALAAARGAAAAATAAAATAAAAGTSTTAEPPGADEPTESARTLPPHAVDGAARPDTALLADDAPPTMPAPATLAQQDEAPGDTAPPTLVSPVSPPDSAPSNAEASTTEGNVASAHAPAEGGRRAVPPAD
jgi:hypothetical protein